MISKQQGALPLSGVLGLAGAAVLAAGTVVYSQGVVRVSVREKLPDGHSIRLVVPGALIRAGLAAVPVSLLQGRMPPEAARIAPVLQAAADGLAECPDGTLVEVRDRADHVTVALREGSLVVDVDSETEAVHVTVPLSLVRAFTRELRAAVPPVAAGSGRS